MKLSTLGDWLKAIASICVTLPTSFETETDALVTSRNLEVLVAQAQFFAFKPIDGDTPLARTLGAPYFEEHLPEALEIELEDYFAINEAVAQLRITFENALLNSGDNWRPTMAETVFKLMTIAQGRFEQSPVPAEKVLSVFSGFCQMLEELAILEERRILGEADAPVSN